MLIATYDGSHLVNLDRFNYLEATYRGDGYWNDIYAEGDEDSILLGRYLEEKTAREAFEHIAQSNGAISVFYMPKE